MTLYYVKPGLSRMRQALKTATGVLEQSKDGSLLRDLRSMKLGRHFGIGLYQTLKTLAEVIP